MKLSKVEKIALKILSGEIANSSSYNIEARISSAFEVAEEFIKACESRRKTK